jgi:hypothetical protein
MNGCRVKDVATSQIRSTLVRELMLNGVIDYEVIGL